jgi:hypothetical protein
MVPFDLHYEGPTDSLGIPVDLDPRKFYELRAAKLETEATGVERLAYQIFGAEWIRSFAFAIDPAIKFKLGPTRVAGVNRIRNVRAGVQSSRSYLWKTTNINGTTLPDESTPDLFDRLPIHLTTTNPINFRIDLNDQTAVTGFLKDTTTKSRPASVNEGECEFFIPQIHSPPRSRYWVNSEIDVYALIGGYLNHSRDVDIYSREGKGPAAYISNVDVQTLVASESSLADAVIHNRALELYNDCSSRRRTYSVSRNIVELRDLPRTLKEGVGGMISLYDTAYKLAVKRYPKVNLKGFHKRVANHFLAKEFGWDQTISDVLGLLASPARIAKRVNYLMARNGKDTSYRTYRNYVEPIVSPPSFSYNPFPNESTIFSSTSGTRTVELRGMVNCNVRLPEIGSWQLKRDLTRRAWGVDPTPADLYNLVPWTWLVDWYTGLGDYVDAFDNINNDQSIINYGFVTYDSRGEVKTDFTGRVTSQHIVLSDGALSYSTSYNDQSHTSVLSYKYKKRVNFADALEHVRPSWDPSRFSGFQAAILGALSTRFI